MDKWFYINNQYVFVFKGVLKVELHFCFSTLLPSLFGVCFLQDRSVHFNFFFFLSLIGVGDVVFEVILRTLSQKIVDSWRDGLFVNGRCFSNL